MTHRSLSYSIDSVSTIVGENISADDWASKMKVVDRKDPRRHLDGADVIRITGVERKSWDPALFCDFAPVVQVAEAAMARAEVSREDIDAVVLVTSTPFYTQLSMDGFELLKRSRLPDHLPPIQLQACCAAVARAMHVLARMDVKRPLILAYEVSSPYMTASVYYQNTAHPLRDHLWMSAALFGDGAGAMVLRPSAEPTGFSFYSRDSLSFGGRPGFEDPLIQLSWWRRHPSTRNCHQASPRLVDEVRTVMMQESGVRAEQMPTHARSLGNIVAPATLKLLDDDRQRGDVGPGDEVCFSVVGARPLRGGFRVPITAG